MGRKRPILQVSPIKLPKPQHEDLAWLGEVRDVDFSLTPSLPITVHRKFVKEGTSPQPTVPHPERHPYYELGINLEGDLLEFIGAEKVKRPPGSLMLLGPGIPHYAFHLGYPHRTISIHFLPILLLENGPQGDGARMLSRFTGARKISERVFQTPKELRRELTKLFEQMADEFDKKESCWELRLRSLLMEILTKIFRWEEAAGRVTKFSADEPNWTQMEKTLRFIHENFTRRIYVGEIAKAVGVTVERLQAMFREAHGISCVHYLQAYRIAQAKALLCTPGMRVTEAAMAVGFGNLSHFITAFRNLTDMSPTEYIRNMDKEGKRREVLALNLPAKMSANSKVGRKKQPAR